MAVFRQLVTNFLRKHGRITEGALEGSSSKNLGEINRNAFITPFRDADSLLVVTLDPTKFAEKKQQCLHIGNLKSFRFHIALQNQSSHVMTPHLYYDTTRRFPCPPDTNAFLYYFTPPEKPRIAGELRFRVVSSVNDPASFERGSDLLKLNGQPWSRPLYVLSRYCIPLYKKLREERLVPDELDAVLSTFSLRNPDRRGQLLYTLNDTFIVDFGCRERYLPILTEQGLETIQLLGAFAQGHPTRSMPYTGRALARFERSTLREHQGTRTVVLRFLKIITPVKCVIPLYDGYIGQPKEGELHRRTPKYGTVELEPPVWSINIDNPNGVMARSLRLLWDATNIL